MSNSTASAFSSLDTAALDRQTEVPDEHPVTFEQIWNETHKKVSIGWIRQNGYKRICLQFPDDYLPHSNAISTCLQTALASDECKIFILADTTYGSCCVDEIAAAHVEADSVIHFGNACRSKASRLPVLYLYPVLPLQLPKVLQQLAALQPECEEREVYVYLDIGYQHLCEQQPPSAELADGEDTLFSQVREVLRPKKLYIEVYPPPAEDTAESKQQATESSAERICIFIGGDNQRFANLSLTTTALQWHILDGATATLSAKNPLTAQYIRRRYYYIEKCKDAQTLGLIVATLSAVGYLDVVTRLQTMAKSRGVKTQLISVGRINPAKLANFLEIDCFVLIGCPFNNMYNSKEYYKPIVSVFEAEMALNPAWHMKYPEAYVTDFKQLLPEGRSFLSFDADAVQVQDVSLVSGRMRGATGSGDDAVETASNTVATQAKMALMTTDTGLTFEDRTWQGLDPMLGQTEPAKLQQGLSGIPIKYSHD
ncbi:2-(3-amino-3-carboxypropyl)histidine synthase subunit 2 [Drosophila grimshawi]|uniref:2-(3-amino-3-carboxypropyl)histidine synthase subunit 2 n=1 Tax=Drosophila grimshawi TaxID=7222 RepID=B4JF34_DROGR|nr:2-(3-amino-3-carboxypropyl)histidine synthase subunit 2 [Drosophila grimshawi]EDV93315.1 GH19238 [Drosophila grimshawi]